MKMKLKDLKDVARFVAEDLFRDKDFLVLLGMWVVAFIIAVSWTFWLK